MDIIKVGNCTCIPVVVNIIPDTKLGSTCTGISPNCRRERVVCVLPLLVQLVEQGECVDEISDACPVAVQRRE